MFGKYLSVYVKPLITIFPGFIGKRIKYYIDFQLSKIIYILSAIIILMSCDKDGQVRTYKLPKENHEHKLPIVNEKQNGHGDLTWEKPASWNYSEGSSMRIASFSVPYKVGEGDLSVIQLSGDGGGLESNVNRWRRQLNMAPISIEEIEKNINIQIGRLGEYSLIKIINDLRSINKAGI